VQGLLTTKVTKVHEGNPENKAFVTLRVLGGSWFFGLPREPDSLPGRGCAEVVTILDDPERPTLLTYRSGCSSGCPEFDRGFSSAEK
jgi:hypothetical protein